ncbi:HlyC/CorC family transporter [Pandoraea sp. XJJ-1]|uniref:HlyC/CorC family transporter n=1 Tax=Pandoraea TaxID=93217 RepID=UPI000477A76C|nr:MULTISPECIES: HlyC/CorC family transporter [Pandoraea]MBN9116589.1 HlyC/CorC family transporter [Pandoraea sp.]WAL82431.1 HlyC/CorC family transporter [Pandoraea sp. XJJ-1]
MEALPLWAQICAVALLIICSGFFSISETSMMALNRHRLKHLVRMNAHGARTTQGLLARTEDLLSTILVGNNVINTVVPVLTTSIAVRYFGNDAITLSVATALIALLIIIFAEIGPKIVGATYPERIALPTSRLLKPIVTLAAPLVWVLNGFVRGMLRVLRIDTRRAAGEVRLTTEELRTIVLEASNYMPTKPRSVLLNLLDLENIAVDDVMVPRARIEALDISAPLDTLLSQLATCYHNKLPVYDGDIDRVIGILPVRRTLAALQHPDDLSADTLRALLVEPYFIPSDTPALRQLQYFQENHRRIGLVVNEYGEVEGLLTTEDIIEELIGEFTTSMPGTGGSRSGWTSDDDCLVSGGVGLRDLNRRLNLHLPTDGPKTLNGLILEVLREIPEATVSLEISGVRMEIVQIDNQAIKMVRLFKPGTRTPSQD